jgi:Family of unknown function (DUF6494)
MDADRFNIAVRQFLKVVGVTSQREIERIVREGKVEGTKLKLRMSLTAENTPQSRCRRDDRSSLTERVLACRIARESSLQRRDNTIVTHCIIATSGLIFATLVVKLAQQGFPDDRGARVTDYSCAYRRRVSNPFAAMKFLARIYAAAWPSSARLWGAAKSRIGPLGTIPVGFMVRWLS